MSHTPRHIICIWSCKQVYGEANYKTSTSCQNNPQICQGNNRPWFEIHKRGTSESHLQATLIVIMAKILMTEEAQEE